MAVRRFAVHILPVPFTERPASKRRPVVVISSEAYHAANAIAIVAMITRVSAPEWLGDMLVDDTDATGLLKPSKVRMKLFTFDCAAFDVPVGMLGMQDQRWLADRLRTVFEL